MATDIAARGIDIQQLPRDVNFDLPQVAEDYVHRIGRTGRAGSAGTSISLICEDDSFMMPDIETLLGNSVSYEQPPQHLLTPAPQAPARSSRPRR